MSSRDLRPHSRTGASKATCLKLRMTAQVGEVGEVGEPSHVRLVLRTSIVFNPAPSCIDAAPSLGCWTHTHVARAHAIPHALAGLACFSATYTLRTPARTHARAGLACFCATFTLRAPARARTRAGLTYILHAHAHEHCLKTCADIG